uniref:Intercellular adhesion molecule N-terminal domain-containing protein n=1 Tax=Vombatus ursinus TaxID=29139 RepID=A0A4X2M8T3_VOMUR
KLLIKGWWLPVGGGDYSVFAGAPGITWIEPPDLVITPGGNLSVNCSTDCDQPQFIGLETQLVKTQVDNGTRWKVFLLKNITQDTLLHCFANCFGDAQMIYSTTVTVIQPPEPVTLESLPQWIPVGQNFSLRCQVWSGKPRKNLTMALLRGPQELSRQAVSEQDPGKAAEVTFTVTASREDHGVNFSCRAGLDLRAQGLGLYQKSSSIPTSLGAPRLLAPKLLEVGKKETLRCDIDKLFPVENAQIHLSLGGRNLNTTVIRDQDMLRATAIVVIAEGEKEGQWELTCNVTLADQNRQVQENLTVYKSPRDPVPIVMGVLLALGLAAMAGAIATLCLWQNLRKSSYQPQTLPLQDRTPMEGPEMGP